jgi:hypothetical protein
MSENKGKKAGDGGMPSGAEKIGDGVSAGPGRRI